MFWLGTRIRVPVENFTCHASYVGKSIRDNPNLQKICVTLSKKIRYFERLFRLFSILLCIVVMSHTRKIL